MVLKVCGIRNQNNLEDLIKIHPDFIGFIFFEKSKRHVAEFPNVEFPNTIKKVGVFVNETHKVIIEKVKSHDLNVVQLHGDETPAYCHILKNKLGCRIEIFKAFSIDEKFDFKSTQAYEEVCSAFVFDAKGRERGGNGVKFNWKMLSDYQGATPYLLSGGIGLYDAELISEFMQTTAAEKCLGVDVNSGFELEPGLKNIEELKQFKELLP